MPCLRNLTISHALQYFDDDIRKKEAKGLDYYSQEDGGVWFGKTAEELGFIDKKFNREDYHSVMKGKFTYYDKISQKNITVDLTKKSSNKEHHAGIELTLSAPKSVSITAEVFKDKRVIDAHIKAVNNVVEYIQNNFVYTRTKINGEMTFEKVDNLLATKFTHHTNRNHDPQLHTHILIANIVIDKNHNIKTAEHTTIFENERFIRELYNNELANNLIQLGYDIDWQKKITQIAPEINGIPQELNDLLSSRRKEIEKFAEEHNLNLESPTAMQFACLATRQTKDNSIGIDELSPVWQEKVKEFNIDIDKLKNKLSTSNKLIDLKNKESIKNILDNTKNNIILSGVEQKYVFDINDNFNKLLSMKSVMYLTGEEFPNNGDNLVERVVKYFEEIGGKVERNDLGGYIKLNKAGVKDSFRHGIRNEKVVVFKAVPKILKEGIIMNKQNNWKERDYNTYLIAAPICIKDKEFIAEGLILESNDGNKRFYLHEVQEKRKFQDYLIQGQMSTETSSKLNIAKFFWEVKENLSNKKENIINNNLPTIVKNSIEHLTERQATFTKEELISSVIDRSNGSYDVKQIENAIEQNKELINANLDIEKYSKHLKVFTDREKIVFTTKIQVAIENKIINLVEQGQNKFKSINNISNTNNKINDVYSTLNNSQKQTVDFILDNKDQFLAIQGYAGVGKTYTIKALNEEFKNKHINLIGLASTHSAADTLKNEAGIQTNTLQSFLAKYNGYANDREISKTSLNNLKEQFKDTIILVDESSLIGNRQMKDLLTIANKFNTRVILQGDEKQLDSVEGGTPFHRLINNKHIEYSELNNILRQKDEQIKTAVQDIIKKDIVSAFNNLKANKHIIELRTDKEVDSNKFKDENLYIYNETTKKNEINKELYNEYLTFLENNSPDKIKKDLVEEVVKTYNKLTKDEKQNTLIITSSNEIRKEINSEIRQEIKQENINNNIDNNKNIILETLEYKSMTNQEKKEIQNYNINDTIIFLKDNNKLNINKNIEYHILDVDKNKKEITLQEKNDDDINKDSQKNKVIINIDKLSNNINLFSKDKKELIINDKIKFNITDKEKGILKGSDFIVKDIDKNKITLAKNSNNTNKDNLIINLNNQTEKNLLKYIDYSYTTTTYSSQGKTSKNVIYTLESYRPILTNQKELYVGVSRTKNNITIITDNINKSINTLLGNTGEKLGAKDIETNNINNTNKANNTEQQINIERNKNMDMEL